MNTEARCKTVWWSNGIFSIYRMGNHVYSNRQGPQSVLNNIESFVRLTKNHANRARIEYRDWCCELLTLLLAGKI